jgi:hypothetical protein
MARTTRTLNPLPLQDLEPHRFEDLIRQLAYDFRDWRSLEAIGRSGSDEGMDIRGVERRADVSAERPEIDGDDAQEDETTEAKGEDRLWVFQCKREKSLGPKKVQSIIADFFSTTPTPPPYGYILAAACDFSKAARDAFAEALRERGVAEFYVWGKGEIEDQLVLPKNDHILFAYFGISLQVRRTSARTHIRSQLTLKRRLVKELGEMNQRGYATVLIRNPADESYPFINDVESFREKPKWRYWEFYAHEPPNHVMFITKRFFAFGDYQTSEWDYITGHDIGVPSHPEVAGAKRLGPRWSEQDEIARAFWELHVAEDKRAWLLELRSIHYDRILAFDEVGDSFNEKPHLLVDYRGDDPFEQRFSARIIPTSGFAMWAIYPEGPDDPKRVKVFPKPIPDERAAWRAELERRIAEHTKR